MYISKMILFYDFVIFNLTISAAASLWCDVNHLPYVNLDNYVQGETDSLYIPLGLTKLNFYVPRIKCCLSCSTIKWGGPWVSVCCFLALQCIPDFFLYCNYSSETGAKIISTSYILQALTKADLHYQAWARLVFSSVLMTSLKFVCTSWKETLFKNEKEKLLGNITRTVITGWTVLLAVKKKKKK